MKQISVKITKLLLNVLFVALGAVFSSYGMQPAGGSTSSGAESVSVGTAKSDAKRKTVKVKRKKVKAKTDSASGAGMSTSTVSSSSSSSSGASSSSGSRTNPSSRGSAGAVGVEMVLSPSTLYYPMASGLYDAIISNNLNAIRYYLGSPERNSRENPAAPINHRYISDGRYVGTSGIYNYYSPIMIALYNGALTNDFSAARMLVNEYNAQVTDTSLFDGATVLCHIALKINKINIIEYLDRIINFCNSTGQNILDVSDNNNHNAIHYAFRNPNFDPKSTTISQFLFQSHARIKLDISDVVDHLVERGVPHVSTARQASKSVKKKKKKKEKKSVSSAATSSSSGASSGSGAGSSMTLSQDFWKLIGQGNKKDIHGFLSQHKQFATARDERGFTPVMKLLFNGFPDTAWFVMRMYGGTLNDSDDRGRTMLMIFAAQGNIVGLQSLLNHANVTGIFTRAAATVNINQTDAQGHTALYHAINDNSVYVEDTVRYLIENGAHITISDCNRAREYSFNDLADEMEQSMKKRHASSTATIEHAIPSLSSQPTGSTSVSSSAPSLSSSSSRTTSEVVTPGSTSVSTASQSNGFSSTSPVITTDASPSTASLSSASASTTTTAPTTPVARAADAEVARIASEHRQKEKAEKEKRRKARQRKKAKTKTGSRGTGSSSSGSSSSGAEDVETSGLIMPMASEFFDAIRSKDLSLIREYLGNPTLNTRGDKEAPINHRYMNDPASKNNIFNGYSAIMIALESGSRDGDFTVARMLTEEYNANVHDTGFFDEGTILHGIVQKTEPARIKKQVERIVHFCNSLGENVLDTCDYRGYNVIQYLLLNPLCQSNSRHTSEIVEYLLTLGAKLYVDCVGEHPGALADRLGYTAEFAQELLKKEALPCNLSIVDVLFTAAQIGDKRTIESILKNNRTRIQDLLGEKATPLQLTPIRVLIWNGYSEIARWLSDIYNANINDRDVNGASCLHACFAMGNAGHIQTAKKVMQLFPDYDYSIKDGMGRSVLTVLIDDGNPHEDPSDREAAIREMMPLLMPHIKSGAIEITQENCTKLRERNMHDIATQLEALYAQQQAAKRGAEKEEKREATGASSTVSLSSASASTTTIATPVARAADAEVARIAGERGKKATVEEVLLATEETKRKSPEEEEQNEAHTKEIALYSV